MALIRAASVVLFLSIPAIGETTTPDEERFRFRKHPEDPSRIQCHIRFATFTVPEGWQLARSGGNTVVILYPSDEMFPDLTRMISIDAGTPATPNAKDLAVSCAKSWKGQVADKTATLDGAVSYRVSGSPTGDELGPVDCILTIKDKRAVMLIAGAKQDMEVSKALDAIAASWEWAD